MAREAHVEVSDDARKDPVRLVVVQDEVRPTVDIHDEEMVMTFPHLLVRELITLVAVSLTIVVLALLFDAPLEELANPEKTPNPAKAPWYFLGLQELLHYYSPLVSGVVLPGLLVVGLVVVPYFKVNLQRESVYAHGRRLAVIAVVSATVLVSAVFFFSGKHPVWPLIGPTLFIGALILWPGITGVRGPVTRWLATRSAPFWIFFWFLVVGFVLTLIGIFFRGPGWTFTVPWRDGIYY